MNINIIEENINLLSTKRNKDDKNDLYDRIAENLKNYFSEVKQKTFNRSLIQSFFSVGQYPKTTENRHIKGIINALMNKGFIANTEIKKISKIKRIGELTTTDFNSYTILMNKNGYNKVDFFKWVRNSDGLIKRKKVDTKTINSDSDGETLKEFDFSVLRQTRPRRQQGVYTFNTKSIRHEKRPYTVKSYLVL